MNTTKDFYKISRKEDTFVAEAFDIYGEKHVLFSEKVMDLKQCGLALVTTENDGAHSIYIPTYKEEEWSSHIDLFTPAILAISGISDYDYFQDTLLLHKDDYFVFINPSIYSLNFNHYNVPEDRRKNLQKLYAKKAFFKKDILLNNKLILNVDGIDYLICQNEWIHADNTSFQHSIIKIGQAFPIAGNNGCAKIVTDDGEYIFEGYNEQLKKHNLYASIVPYTDQENQNVSSVIFSNDMHYGYWLKDSDGNICGTSIFPTNQILSGYHILLKKPAKSLICIKHFPNYRRSYTDLWKVDYIDEGEMLIIKRPHEQYEISIKEIL